MENCSFADINLRLDRRTRHAQAAIRTIWSWGKFTGTVVRKRNSLVRHPVSLSSLLVLLFLLLLLANHPLRVITFSSRRIAIMLILTTRFIAPFRSGASMRRTRLKKNDGKSFRLRFTLRPHSYPPPISLLRVYIPPSHSSAGIRSRFNVYTFGIRVLEVENVELYYMGGERVSSTQSRDFALTGSPTTPVSGIKGAGY